ncbi:unnamed protein product [Auanema sp. JU1783]|nr:unnamed protein product [Auanema sp. JU1783]
MTPPQFDVDTEVEKLSKTCLSNEDHELFWNNTLKHTLVRLYNAFLIDGALEMIGQTEMRATLNFAPRRSWKSCEFLRSERPSENALASAATIEAYYDLVEPQSYICNLDKFFLEKNMTPAIAFLDNRFPFIRAYYRRSFEEISQSDGGEINRKLVDNMIHKFEVIVEELKNATYRMLNHRIGECQINYDL